MNRSLSFLIGSVLLLMPVAAGAQFQGDVFFAQPSLTVPEGGTATVEVQMFSGADVLGAAQVDVVFDPASVSVVGIGPGTAPELAGGLASATLQDRIGIVALNGASLLQPFGTVSLARLQMRPLLPAGSRIPLNIEVHSLLRQDAASFPDTHGFAGEILVIAAGAKASVSSGQLLASPLDGVVQRARAFRRPGLAVDLFDFENSEGRVSATLKRVVVPDPSAPAERPR